MSEEESCRILDEWADDIEMQFRERNRAQAERIRACFADDVWRSGEVSQRGSWIHGNVADGADRRFRGMLGEVLGHTGNRKPGDPLAVRRRVGSAIDQRTPSPSAMTDVVPTGKLGHKKPLQRNWGRSCLRLAMFADPIWCYSLKAL